MVSNFGTSAGDPPAGLSGLRGEDSGPGNAYAVQHDRDFGIMHTFENWMAEVLCKTGPEADARRERILPMWHQDRSRNPLTIVNGPSEPLDETVRKRFFCED